MKNKTPHLVCCYERWPELETTARPGEESRGGGGAGWGSRRCGSGQPAVPAGGISPTESSGCQRAPGPEVVPLHSYPQRGLTHVVCANMKDCETYLKEYEGMGSKYEGT